jgi:hypothetical protein
MNYFMIGGDGREYGPVDAEQLRLWVREGRANGETLLRLEGETEWKPLRSFPDFEAEFGPPPATAAAPPPVAGFVEGPHDVPVLVGHSFARAWHLVGQHFGVIFTATLMVWLTFTVFMYAGWLSILIMIFYGPLLGGLFMVFLKLIRVGQATPADLFALTRDHALPLILTGFVSLVLTQIATVCCCVLPGIYLQIAWLLALPLVADRGVGFWEGLETSRRVVTRHWFKVFALFVVAFLPWLVFHVYMMTRLGIDLSPHLQKAIEAIRDAMASGGSVNQAVVQKIALDMNNVEQGYAAWSLIKQLLLLVSLPFGVGSLAFVYEDLFGRKK